MRLYLLALARVNRILSGAGSSTFFLFVCLLAPPFLPSLDFLSTSTDLATAACFLVLSASFFSGSDVLDFKALADAGRERATEDGLEADFGLPFALLAEIFLEGGSEIFFETGSGFALGDSNVSRSCEPKLFSSAAAYAVAAKILPCNTIEN